MVFIKLYRNCIETLKTSRSAIAGNPRFSVFKLGPKYNCENHASNITLSYGVDVDK